MTAHSTDLKTLLKDPSLLETRAFVAGEWVDADDGKTFPVRNPARGDVIAEVADLSRAEVRRAIEAAHAAMKGWQAKTAKERAQVMRKWFDLMMANQEDLAQIMTAEQGKPLAEARNEIAYAASFVEWFAEEGRRVAGETIATNDPAKRLLVLRQPVPISSPQLEIFRRFHPMNARPPQPAGDRLIKESS
mgnify:CR=1 FL=1